MSIDATTLGVIVGAWRVLVIKYNAVIMISCAVVSDFFNVFDGELQSTDGRQSHI